MEKKKSLFSRIFSDPRVLAIIGLTIIILISFPIARNISHRYEINKEINDLKNEISEIEGKNTTLKKLINYLSSEQFTEEQARLNFGLKKEGESAAVIDFKKDAINSLGLNQNAKISYNSNVDDKSKNNPQRWLKYFFK